MKQLILKWLGIRDSLNSYKREIKDLNTTISTLKDKLTDANKKYEQIYLLMHDIGTEDVKGIPWWERRTSFENMETHMLVENIKHRAAFKWIEENPSLKVHKIFHGGCLSCIVPERDGVGACRECMYANNLYGEDLSEYKSKT